jgi:hypothetical protein
MNAVGTLNLQEDARRFCPESPFHPDVHQQGQRRPPEFHRATRVGDALGLRGSGLRERDPEEFSIDQSKHLLFGASKLAGDRTIQTARLIHRHGHRFVPEASARRQYPDLNVKSVRLASNAALCQDWMHMRLACLLVGCLPVLGQTSGVSSVTKAPGESVTLDILLSSQPSRAPIALTWEVVFPAQLMEMEGDAPEIGRAAKDSGKRLQCTAPKPYANVCALSGGQNPIGNGPIAIFHFRIRTTAKAGTTTLRIERAEATTVDSKEETLANAEAIVIIR